MPRSYVIPSLAEAPDEPWPNEVRGLELGALVSRIRQGKQYTLPEQQRALEDLGFVWSHTLKQMDFEVILTALKAHYQIFGDFLVPRYFIVPHGDKEWPRETWGLRLGVRVKDINYCSAYSEPCFQNKLKSIGYFQRQIE